MSILTERPSATNCTAVARIRPVPSAARAPTRRHANPTTSAIVRVPATAEGRRAAHSSGPNAVNVPANNQKYPGGLS